MKFLQRLFPFVRSQGGAPTSQPISSPADSPPPSMPLAQPSRQGQSRVPRSSSYTTSVISDLVSGSQAAHKARQALAAREKMNLFPGRDHSMTPSSTSGSTWGFPNSIVKPLEDAYVASLPPALYNLMLMDGENQPDGTNPKVDAAKALSLKGYAVDFPIQVYNWDIFTTMYIRGGFRFTEASDGVTQIAYDGQQKMIVSTDPADFKPYPKPVATVDPNAVYIDKPKEPARKGAQWFPTMKTVTDALPDGTILEFEGMTFQLHVVATQSALQSGVAPQLIYTWIQTSDNPPAPPAQE